MLRESTSRMFRELLLWNVVVVLVVHVSSSSNQKPSPCQPIVNNAPGIPGLPGKPGDPGSAGRDGRDGLKGLDGATGSLGPGGPIGVQGPVGPQGKSGPQGPPGTTGKTGAQGPPGTPGKTGIQAPPGQMPLFNWKECSWNDINDGRDTGKIKDCLFTKNHSDTTLHVYWDGNLRIASCDSCCKRWYFTFNGAECSGPVPIDGVVYMQTGTNKNLLRHRHIEGHCQNILKGRVRVGFWVGNCRRYGNADAYTGWKSYSRIFVEEIPGPQN